MHNSNYDELFFASKYVQGLRDDIKAVVEPQVLVTVDRAALIAKIQQRTLERTQLKTPKSQFHKPPPQKGAIRRFAQGNRNPRSMPWPLMIWTGRKSLRKC
jgi:hypothetical protein